MKGIFGIFCRDGAPVTGSMMEMVQRAMSGCRQDASVMWCNDCILFGQTATVLTGPSLFRQVPQSDDGHEKGFVFAGRVDNRQELAKSLGIPAGSLGQLTDGEIVYTAYTRWGERSPEHIYGDWAFAAWDPKERRLFLARDHFGITALYYHANPEVFAFATSPDALLALDLAPHTIDELYVAQVLTVWPAYHGERTAYQTIRRLSPAHWLSVTRDRLDTHQYWFLEKVPEIRFLKREDYVAGFLEVFDEAVHARLRSSEGSSKDNLIAATLSGGLDSGAVSATAAPMLAAENRSMVAFTSVPLFDVSSYVGGRFGDEFPLAEATARFAGNMPLHPITAADMTPIQAIRKMLEIHHEPVHATGNLFWLLDLMRVAKERGAGVLLMGQFGNAGISWTGDISSQPFRAQLAHAGLRPVLKDAIRNIIPLPMLALRHRMKLNSLESEISAIHPDFARRLRLWELRSNDPETRYRPSAREKRLFILPGRCMGGALLANMGSAYGLEIRDPTADVRVLTYTFGVPDRIFIDPETGLDRWLVREGMKGRLPDEVRLNRCRGRQAGDLVPRLRACAEEVEGSLQEIAGGPAAEYVDVNHLRRVWQLVRQDDTPEAFRKAATILARGMMAGLFINSALSGR